MTTPSVRLVEVGLRDGLQNEAVLLPTDAKIQAIEALIAAGLRDLEIGALVRPDLVPAMADTAAVMAGLSPHAGVRYLALVPNLKGLQRALEAKIPAIAVLTAASDTFSRRNINMSRDQALTTALAITQAAQAKAIPVRGYISTCWYCPYEGAVDPARVVELAQQLLAGGCYEVSLGDTIGTAQPTEVAALLQQLVTIVPAAQLALHLHDTHGRALENIRIGLDHGITTFDAAVGGLGGCPFAPGAAGNVATEAVVAMLDGMGIRTGIDVRALQGVAATLRRQLGTSALVKGL